MGGRGGLVIRLRGHAGGADAQPGPRPNQERGHAALDARRAPSEIFTSTVDPAALIPPVSKRTPSNWFAKLAAIDQW